MAALDHAVDQFLSAIDRHRDLAELNEATLALHRQLPRASADELNEALGKLRPVILRGHILPASAAVVSCGALVEFGGNPAIAGEAILERLPQLLRGATDFLGEVRRRANVGEDEHPDLDQLLNLHINDLLETHCEAAWAFMARHPYSKGLLAHLARSKELRAIARARSHLTESLRALERLSGKPLLLGDMLHVLDDEPLLVLHPGEKKGFELRMSGIADNVQLQILLADALVGDPAAGWLAGRKPDATIAAAARNGPVAAGRWTFTGAFDLWGWPALSAAGEIHPERALSPWRIKDEGRPADIQPFAGVRIVLLGPSRDSRTWNAVRRFPAMPGELVVERLFDAAAVREWLVRLAAAQRPATPPT